jgi:hypothetical protein
MNTQKTASTRRNSKGGDCGMRIADRNARQARGRSLDHASMLDSKDATDWLRSFRGTRLHSCGSQFERASAEVDCSLG